MTAGEMKIDVTMDSSGALQQIEQLTEALDEMTAAANRAAEAMRALQEASKPVGG